MSLQRLVHCVTIPGSAAFQKSPTSCLDRESMVVFNRMIQINQECLIKIAQVIKMFAFCMGSKPDLKPCSSGIKQVNC